MSRVLFVVPPLVGHVNPTVPLGLELGRRGHDVAWAGLPTVVDRLLPEGAGFHPIVGGIDTDAERLQEAARGLRGAAALKFLWEDFLVPLARGTAPELRALVDEVRPDVLVVDQQAVGGAVVGRLAGIPWLTSATTSAELTDPLAALPRVDAWVREQLVDLQVGLGVPRPVALGGDLRFSERLVLAFTTEALAGDITVPPSCGPVAFVGPSLEARPETAAFPFERLDPARPLVLVSLGTVNAEIGERFYGVVVEALRGGPAQVVVAAPPDLVPVPPDDPDLVVAERVPQLALLARASTVVTHGGHNTVCEALAEGLPLVVAPIRDDQPIVAEQVVAAGAGIRVRFARVGAEELRAAVLRALTDPGLRAGAAAVRASFASAGGASAAADAVEQQLGVLVP